MADYVPPIPVAILNEDRDEIQFFTGALSAAAAASEYNVALNRVVTDIDLEVGQRQVLVIDGDDRRIEGEDVVRDNELIDLRAKCIDGSITGDEIIESLRLLIDGFETQPPQ